MKDPLQPPLEKPLHAIVTLLSVLAIAMIMVYVYRDCEWIALRSAGQETCEIWDGWAVLSGLFAVVALYFGWRVYAKPRQE